MRWLKRRSRAPSDGDVPERTNKHRRTHRRIAHSAPHRHRTYALVDLTKPDGHSLDHPIDLTASDASTSSPATPRTPSPAAPRAPRVKRVTSEDPGEFVMQPLGEHTHTVILLHSMYCPPDACEMLQKLPSYLSRLGHSNIKFVFPYAPRRTISWPTGPETDVPSWYNYFTRRDGELAHDELDEAHLASQTRRIHAMLDREAALLGGDPRRLILGGSSQGGTVAIHAAVGYGRELGGLLALRSCLIDTVTAPSGRNAAANTPVYVFVAGDDRVYAPELQHRGYGHLESAGFRVEWKTESKLTHWDASRNEKYCAAAWISQIASPRILRRSGSPVAVDDEIW